MPDIITLAADGEFLTRTGTTIDGKTAAEARTALDVYTKAETDTAIGNAASGVLTSVRSVTGGNVATTSATFADVDAAGLAVTFTFPASGVVILTVNARVSVDSANTYQWNLRQGAADVADTVQTMIYHDAGGSIGPRLAAEWRLTGTPGATATYKLGHARSFGTGSTLLVRGTADPVTLKVLAA